MRIKIWNCYAEKKNFAIKYYGLEDIESDRQIVAFEEFMSKNPNEWSVIKEIADKELAKQAEEEAKRKAEEAKKKFQQNLLSTWSNKDYSFTLKNSGMLYVDGDYSPAYYWKYDESSNEIEICDGVTIYRGTVNNDRMVLKLISSSAPGYAKAYLPKSMTLYRR